MSHPPTDIKTPFPLQPNSRQTSGYIPPEMNHNNSSPILFQQLLTKRPISVLLLNAIIFNSRYIPQAKRNSYLTSMRNYKYKQYLCQFGLVTYGGFNFLARKTKWWRLTTDLRTVVFKTLLFFYFLHVNAMNSVHYSFKFIDENKQLLSSNWENIIQQPSINKIAMAFSRSNRNIPHPRQNPRGSPINHGVNPQPSYNTQQNLNPQQQSPANVYENYQYHGNPK